MANIRVNIELCKGCKLCVLNCPQRILRLGNEVNSKGYEYPIQIESEKCTACAFCGLMCPESAITVYK